MVPADPWGEEADGTILPPPSYDEGVWVPPVTGLSPGPGYRISTPETFLGGRVLWGTDQGGTMRVLSSSSIDMAWTRGC